MIVAIVIISIILLGLFLGVTLAGGRAHERQNALNAGKKRCSPITAPLLIESVGGVHHQSGQKTDLVELKLQTPDGPVELVLSVRDAAQLMLDIGNSLKGAARHTDPVGRLLN